MRPLECSTDKSREKARRREQSDRKGSKLLVLMFRFHLEQDVHTPDDGAQAEQTYAGQTLNATVVEFDLRGRLVRMGVGFHDDSSQSETYLLVSICCCYYWWKSDDVSKIGSQI